uniref:Uncharacterized protein n=1 Tax=Steinernema glaseri TaxID=37863 RepID=A0A1I7ZXL4_9BILA
MIRTFQVYSSLKPDSPIRFGPLRAFQSGPNRNDTNNLDQSLISIIAQICHKGLDKKYTVHSPSTSPLQAKPSLNSIRHKGLDEKYTVLSPSTSPLQAKPPLNSVQRDRGAEVSSRLSNPERDPGVRKSGREGGRNIGRGWRKELIRGDLNPLSTPRAPFTGQERKTKIPKNMEVLRAIHSKHIRSSFEIEADCVLSRCWTERPSFTRCYLYETHTINILSIVKHVVKDNVYILKRDTHRYI